MVELGVTRYDLRQEANVGRARGGESIYIYMYVCMYKA